MLGCWEGWPKTFPAGLQSNVFLFFFGLWYSCVNGLYQWADAWKGCRSCITWGCQPYPRTPQSILDAKLHWFTLQQQSQLQRLTVVDMQMCPWGAPDYLKKLLTPKQSSIVTRSRFKLTLKAPKTCKIHKSFQRLIRTIWVAYSQRADCTGSLQHVNSLWLLIILLWT